MMFAIPVFKMEQWSSVLTFRVSLLNSLDSMTYLGFAQRSKAGAESLHVGYSTPYVTQASICPRTCALLARTTLQQ